MKRSFRIWAAAWTLLLIIGLAGCQGEETPQDDSYFGMDLTEWNPLVIYAADGDEDPCFARDSSQISMVLNQFDQMDFTLSQEDYGTPAGLAFAVDTMRGRVELGRTDGTSLWVGGRRYQVEGSPQKREAFIGELRRLYGLIRAETEGITEVTRETVLSLQPEMTYRQLLDLFGKTLQTAVVGVENAFLYQLEGQPFYITFEEESDPVGIDGETLLEELGEDYNLSSRLQQPEPLPGGRVDAYTAAFQAFIEEKDLTGQSLAVDARELPFTEEGDEEKIAGSLPISVTADGPVLQIEAYYHMAEDAMRFRIACGEDRADVECVLQEGQWLAAVVPQK